MRFIWKLFQLSVPVILATTGGPVATLSMAADVIPIHEILAEASSYQLKQVTIEGIVRNLQVIPVQMRDSTGICVAYHGYTCTLVDDTGEMEMYNGGVCFDSGGTVGIKDGDYVRVNAKVQLLHAGEYGHARASVRGIMTEVVRLTPKE